MIETKVQDYEETLIDLVSTVGDKIAIEIPHEHFMIHVDESRGLLLKRVLNDRVLLDMKALVIKQHNKYFDLIDKKLQQLFESGIFATFFRFFDVKLDPKRFEELKTHKALSFDELEAGFVICFVPLFFCIAVFCFEWSVVFKDFIIYRNVFEKLFEVYWEQLEKSTNNLEVKICAWNEIVEDRLRQKEIAASSM